MSCAASLTIRPFRKLAPGLRPWVEEDFSSPLPETLVPSEVHLPLDIWLPTARGAECLPLFVEHRRTEVETLH